MIDTVHGKYNWWLIQYMVNTIHDRYNTW
jgi:hypothetical protein